MYNEKYKIDENKIKKIIKELKEKYDYIIIDNSSETFLKYTKTILENSDLILFFMENNKTEKEKSRSLINIYLNEWNIKKEKIYIIFNKINFIKIKKEKYFEKIEVLEKISYKKYFSLKNIFLIYKTKKINKKIIEKL